MCSIRYFNWQKVGLLFDPINWQLMLIGYIRIIPELIATLQKVWAQSYIDSLVALHDLLGDTTFLNTSTVS